MNNFAARCVERMDWDRRYQIGDIPWEKGAPAPPLLEWLQACGPLHGNILVPGCGYGHDVRAIAAAAPDAKVIGLDISPSAIERARQFPVAGQEAYELGDLFNLPERFSGAFQWVFEHTCFCVIDPERRFDYVRAIAGALRSGGFLLAIFFLNPWDEDEEPAGCGPPFGVSIAELDQLFGRVFDRIDEKHPRSSFPGREGREIIWLLRKR
jgi:methyl halide transferase